MWACLVLLVFPKSCRQRAKSEGRALSGTQDTFLEVITQNVTEAIELAPWVSVVHWI